MTKDLFAIRLHEARLLMNLSMEKLAELTDGIITKQSISRYEKGIMRPKHDAQRALAQALHISEEYFKGENLQIDMPMLRTTSKDNLTKEELDAIEAKLTFWAEQYIAKEKKGNFHTHFENPIKGSIVSTKEDVILAANLLRRQWHCGDGAIPSILRLLERKGIKIMLTELPNNILGLSTWADKQHPLIVLDMRPEKATIERLRLTAVHELAHLLLSFPEPETEDKKKLTEKLCTMFASFFLLPKSTFIEELGGTNREKITVEEMIDIKEQYGISLQALIITARDYDIITTPYKRWWYEKYIGDNIKEIGMGHYPIPETIGREKRIDSIVSHIKEGE